MLDAVVFVADIHVTLYYINVYIMGRYISCTTTSWKLFTGICEEKQKRVRFHRIRDFRQYDFNSIPPTSQPYNVNNQ